jgi:hypothetical protein
MSRANYSDDFDDYYLVALWRGAVRSALRGRRGQAFLRDLLSALQALPDKRLIAGSMEKDGRFCAIGALGKARGVDMSDIDRMIENENDEQVGEEVAFIFGIAEALAREIMWVNDEAGLYNETDEQRYQRVVRWVEGSCSIRT